MRTAGKKRPKILQTVLAHGLPPADSLLDGNLNSMLTGLATPCLLTVPCWLLHTFCVYRMDNATSALSSMSTGK
jgi:hypothetical protein